MKKTIFASVICVFLFHSIAVSDSFSGEYGATLWGDAGINFSGGFIDIEGTDVDTFGIDLEFGGGYLVEDFIEVGGLFVLGYDKQEIDYDWSGADSDRTMFSLEIGPYVFFHLLNSEKMRFYMGPAVTIIVSKFEEDDPGDYEEDGFGFGLYGTLGMNYFLTKNLALNYSGNVGYNQIEYEVEGAKGDSDGIVFGVGAGLKYFFDRF